MNRQARFRSRICGLSLVELLVALALAAMMLAPLAAMLSNMARASALASDRTALARDADFALERIGAVVRATPPTPATLLTPASDGSTNDSGSWFGVEFRFENGQLLQKNPDGVVADNVTAFSITPPYVEGGQQLVQVSLSMARGSASVASGLTLRLGGMR